MSTCPFIELSNIGYRYPGQDKVILDKLNFSINDEKIGLIGPNGCGKTTLFHIIMGLILPDSGDIFHRGKKLEGKDSFVQLRREVGLLFQHSDDQLFSPTVIEDVAFGPLNLGYKPEEAKTKATATLERLGLSGFEERITHRLSGGEKKLVALATILAMDPCLLLLDEPTNDLDPKTRTHLTTVLKELRLPLVIISHDWDFLADTTNTLFALEKGHIQRCEEGHVHEHRHIHPYGNKPHQHND